jgi:glycerol-3-phosphate O-acyltransferase
MDEQALIRQMESYRDLLQQTPYSDITALPDGHGEDWLQHTEALGLFSRSQHPMGDLIQTDDRQAVTLTYYRNNVLHLIALPSLIACLFVNNQRYNRDQVHQRIQQMYSFLQAELFLHWQTEELEDSINQWLDALVAKGYLFENAQGFHATPAASNEFAMLRGLADNVMQTLERYFLTVSLLMRRGSGTLTAKDTEEQSTLLAQRISLLYGINAPEFFDKSLFRTLILHLQERGLLAKAEDDTLTYGASLGELSESLEAILDGALRQSILRSLEAELPQTIDD